MKPAPGAPQKLPAPISLTPHEDGNLWLEGLVRVTRHGGKTEIHVMHPIVAGEPKACTSFVHEEIIDLSKKVHAFAAEKKALEDRVAAREPDARIAELAAELDKRGEAADARRHEGTVGSLFAQQAVAYRDAAALLRNRFGLAP